MPGEPRTIVVAFETPGPTQSFPLPQGVVFDVEAVFVQVDSTGAGGPVTAELTIAEQSGQVIAKKRQAETIDAGISGSATWALRLADDGASTPPPPSGATLPWGMFTGALDVADNSAGQPYPTGYPEVTPFVNLHTGLASPFVIGSGADLGKLCVTEDGIYVFTLAIGRPWTQITGLGIPSPFYAVSLRAGFGNDPAPPFGQDMTYDCTLLGALNVTTIGAVTGATPGAPKQALEIGIVNVGGMDLIADIGVIATKIDPRYTPLFP